MSDLEVLTSVKQMGSRIEDIIREAGEFLVIISPYVKIDREIKSLLEDKGNENGIKIYFVYGKKSLDPAIMEWLDSLPNVQTLFLKDLHAKCYLNEKKALVTSLNLYDYSMINNVEMGVYVALTGGFWGDNDRDGSLHKRIVNEAKRIIDQSEPPYTSAATKQATPSKAPKSTKSKGSKSDSQATSAIATGFCIRCSREIAADPGKPFCDKDFKIWNKFKKEDYEERHCHLCDQEKETTKAKPVCTDCWKEHKKFVKAALA